MEDSVRRMRGTRGKGKEETERSSVMRGRRPGTGWTDIEHDGHAARVLEHQRGVDAPSGFQRGMWLDEHQVEAARLQLDRGAGRQWQAIGEAAHSLRSSSTWSGGLTAGLYAAAVGRSATQLLSFLVNAAKGTPIASITGAPELLSALTDITSFASGRAEIYTLVLLFYTGVVALVVWACERARRRLQQLGVT